jgi:hypothetical protein
MPVRDGFRQGLSFGIIMGIFFVIQNFWMHDNHTTNQVVKSIVSGLAGGIISGVLFGWLMGLFARSKFVSKTTKIETEAGESILFETPANHFVGIEAVGGKLYLTDKRLIFKSHKLNVQNHQLSINLSDIKQVDRYKTLEIVNNGLLVTIRNGTKERFVVEDVEEWATLLRHRNSVQ